MIGRAGTGSPEAGIVLRVDPRVLVYTFRTGDEIRHTHGNLADPGSPVCRGRAYLTTSPCGTKSASFCFFFLGSRTLRFNQFISSRLEMRQTFW